MMLWIVFGFQLLFTMIVMSPLLRGIKRLPPVQPKKSIPNNAGKVSVIIPTLNEVERLSPCLDGMMLQGPEVREILVVDSNSKDGTRELVQEYTRKDSRIKLLTDDPLPPGWVGRPWALNYGYQSMSSESKWFLGLDADTQPQSGMVAGILAAAKEQDYDLVSFGPKFILKDKGELFLQPALLVTLIYRFGAPGTGTTSPAKTMANGQLFLAKRSVLESVNGYKSAKSSFCDDVTLARHIADQGNRVSFMDGGLVYKVRMYEGWKETWKEWGRSLDLKDGTSRMGLAQEVTSLFALQGLPIPLLGFLSYYSYYHGIVNKAVFATLLLNAFILVLRFTIQAMIRNSYDLSLTKNKWVFWFSPFADPLAFIRILFSAFRRPKSWRGREY